jgi:aldose 1-epimerase
MSMAILAIGAGDLELGLVPELGGSVAYLRLRQGKTCIDLLRPLSDADHAAGDILGVAMFPMVPYANCIEDNGFVFDGRQYRVEPNLPHYKFNFHGTGWRLPWTMAAAGASEATLALIDDRPELPHRYSALQHFAVAPDRLTVATTITNVGPCRMPFGFGQHPWFPRRPQTLITFSARRFWIESVDSSATEAITIPPELDFAVPRPPPTVRRNNCYGRWSGSAEIAWPEYGIGLGMTAEAIFRHLMVYFPAPPAEVFCIEPQTNLVSALTRTGAADELDDPSVIVLDPGQSATGTIVFAPFRI